MTAVTALEGMANTVLLIGEWLLKQQQLQRQASLLEEEQRQIEQQKQIKEKSVDFRRKTKKFSIY